MNALRLQWRKTLLELLPPVVVRGLRWLRARGAEETDQALPEILPPVPQASAAPLYWGLQNLDQQIEKYLDFDDGFYVELGANDGLRFSNTYYYETQRGWHGILIEPTPNRFLECRSNRAEKNFVACAACVSFGFKPEFVKMIYCDLMSVATGLETDISDATGHAELGRQFLANGADNFIFGAYARTLNSILLEAEAPNLIDFLSLDV